MVKTDDVDEREVTMFTKTHSWSTKMLLAESELSRCELVSAELNEEESCGFLEIGNIVKTIAASLAVYKRDDQEGKFDKTSPVSGQFPQPLNTLLAA